MQWNGSDGGDNRSDNSGSSQVLQTAAAIMLSGGYMYNALAAGNQDAVENEGDTLDVCLDHPSP